MQADRARPGWASTHVTLTVLPYARLQREQGHVRPQGSCRPSADPPKVTFPELQRATLGNGLKVVLLERHGAPLVNAALASGCGRRGGWPADAAGTARFALDLLLKGTTTRNTFQLADERDALGAQLDVGNTLDLSTVRLSALRPNLSGSLALLADVARNPAFPEDMVEIQRKQQLAAIAQQQASPTGAAQRVLPGLIYGPGHAYANPGGGLGRASIVQSTVAASPFGVAHLWFKPGSATLIVAGDVTMAQLLPEIERASATGPPAPRRPRP